MRGDSDRHHVRGWTRKKRGEGSLLVSFARGTRALRRTSFDARSGRPSRPPSREGKTSKLGKEGVCGKVPFLLAERALETNRATPVVRCVTF